MAVKGISAPAAGAMGAGALFLYSGITNRRVTDVLRAVLSGKAPPSAGAYPLATTPSATSTPASTTTSSIANDALKYEGHPYLSGGAPGPSGTSPWDCSSFCNWVLGHDLGMTLPGSSTPGYSGTSHGPTTLSYLAWAGAQTVGHGASQTQPGDLCVWQTHMGIAIGNGQMISALDEQLGTQVTSISGGAPPGELLFVRRVIIGNPDA
jgi:cell wall-associated NlpC family hydrolase